MARADQNKNIMVIQDANFQQKITFTVGICYLGGFLIGTGRGCLRIIPKISWNLPRKLIMNRFFNSMASLGFGTANKWAAASLLYGLTGSTLNFLLEEELAGFSNFQKNVLFGIFTGGIYKARLGLIPTCVGSIIGGSTIASLNFLTN